MKNNLHQPITGTIQTPQETTRLLKRVMKLFIIICIITNGGGIYYLVSEPPHWILASTLLFVGIGFAFLIFLIIYFIKKMKRYEVDYELNEQGYFQVKRDLRTGTKENIAVPFDSIHEIIVGNNMIDRSQYRVVQFYTGAFMVLKYGDNQICFIEFFDNNELYQWIDRFHDKGIPLFQTYHDLRPAYLDAQKMSADFNQLEGKPWNGKNLPITLGETIQGNPFPPWEPESEKASDKQKPDMDIREQTKKWEFRTGVVLFIYAVILGFTVMPWQPVDEDNVWVMGSLFILGVFILNILLPIILVFWRSYTKWYLPIVYFAVMLIGHSLPVWFVSLFVDTPPLLLTVFSFDLLVFLFGWIPGFILVKILKGIYHFLKYNLRRE
ncbi:hypothetical protein [Oceanobacillus jeddahense]|uniref:Uncharacterized protein n=1 Tax=Oceanobacillus jeddahense TaxID=1462527 RepID=A0ABY5K0I9_9BACI|nr:hypothetical protein [Oceanobacillus jeddahense]UUI04913.1 hypothetical protein NP439_09870 [Oceanobacillus jeddahense]